MDASSEILTQAVEWFRNVVWLLLAILAYIGNKQIQRLDAIEANYVHKEDLPQLIRAELYDTERQR